MIKNLTLASGILLWLGGGCGMPSTNITPETTLENTIAKIEADKQSKPHIYYVNIDKSGSKSDADHDYEFTLFKETITPYFRRPLDQIVVVHAYDNSGSIRNFHRYTLKTAYPNLDGLHDFEEKMRVVMGYFNALNREKVQILNTIKTVHFEPIANAPKSEILSSLYRIADDMNDYKDTRIYRLLALTDGKEESSFRSFKANLPVIARKQGLEDAKKLHAQYALPKDAFRALVSIRFKLPSETIRNADRSMNFVKAYWEEVFKYFGSPVTPDFTNTYQ